MTVVRVLGIDPGTRVTGYACVEGDEARPTIVEAGVFRLAKGGGGAPSLSSRLVELERDLVALIGRVVPEAAAVEALFAHYKHPATAVMMGHARGVITLTLERAGLEVIELAPKSVKMALTGSGGAGKRQMQEAAASVFRLAAVPEPADVADALGIAYAGLVRGGDRLSPLG